MLVSPTTPTTAFKIGERVDDPMAMYLADLATIPADLAGNAGHVGAVRAGPEDGLPVGLQIMAPALADDRAYRVAAAVEAAFTERWGHPLLADATGRPASARPATSRRSGPMTAHARALRRGGGALRAGHRAGDPRRAGHRDQDVLRLPGHVRRRAQHPDLPGLPGAARGAAGVNADRDRVAIRIGLALNCSIAEWCRFARKNYFYPDMPKNFQTSQYDEPLCIDG